ncbi:hypothetical protein [Tessaracoccus antarcticus]|uniref:Uncharacterized protein n=1 Tax=Tessaracoccus antarcticus TaxID=2479848 RepID=A0A3M0GBI4_9ACTN|nr:hypothetical protein [Tessaracoccus antarcticus]RMB58409.1 hypothetical protein EAX62_14565 [Tessaracoccus antarcticus]
MAEIRKHNPESGDGLGDLVRRALGETIRPTPPGQQATSETGDPHHGSTPPEDEPRADALPTWPSDGPTFTF